MLSIPTLRRLLRYEPDTGKLYWRARTAADFRDGGHSAEHNAAKWNAKFVGIEAGCPSNGYLTVGILGVQYPAHRVVWAIWYGVWPTGEVDHEDHHRANNRISNLRDLTPAENMKNLSLRRDTKSGVSGVHWHNRSQRWVAKIQVAGHSIHLGNHICPGAAAVRRALAERELGFHPNHGRAA
jgi:hypothetical protein